MKILMIEHNRYDFNAIVSLNSSEMQKLCNAGYTDVKKLQSGDEVTIAKHYDHVMETANKIAQYDKLPQSLRTLADMLDMQKPVLADILAVEDSENDEHPAE